MRKAVVGAATSSVLLTGVAPTGAFAATAVEPTGSLVWFAEDGDGATAAEASFDVISMDGTVIVVTDNGSLDENVTAGALTVQVPVGRYVVNQTSAPEGLRASEESHTVEVTTEGQVPGSAVVFVSTPVTEETDEDEAAEDVAAEEAAGGDEAGQDGAAVTQEPAEPAGDDEPSEPVAENDTAPSETVTSSNAERAPPAGRSSSERVVTPASVPSGNPGTNEAHLTVTKGGDRVGSTTQVTGLTGASFDFYRVTSSGSLTGGTKVGSCTTEPGDAGTCGITVPLSGGNNYFYVMETGAPSGWSAPLTWGSSSDHVRYNTGAITQGGTVDSRKVTLPGTDRTFPDVRDNPALPAQCGLDIALVFDVSGSVSSYMPQYKTAGKGFVDALAGTPSRIALYSFASQAPARGNTDRALTSVASGPSGSGATALKSHIDGLQIPASTYYYTNWDRGLSQVDASKYDAVIFLTDGDPTTFGNGSTSNTNTNGSASLRTVEEGIHSANKVKVDASLIVVGIGSGVSGTASQKRLSLLSSDFHTSGFDQVGDLLRELALKSCLGTLTVVKQERDRDGQLHPGEDWTFSTTTSDVTPASDQTDANGAVNFEVGGYTDTLTARDITVSETQQPGFTLEKQGGRNASCTNNVTGQPVTVADSGAAGFTVNVPRDAAVSCQVINKMDLFNDLTVTKTATTSYERDYTWSIDKVVQADRFAIPAGGSATPTYDVTVTAKDVVDSDVNVVGQVEVTNPNDVDVSGVTIADALPGASCTIPSGTGLTVPKNSSITVGYTCTATDTTTVGSTNSATVTWDTSAYPGTSGSAVATAPVTFGDPGAETNRYVTITDVFDGGTPALLPLPGAASSLDWTSIGKGRSVTLSYDQEIDDATPGTCTAYPNVAQVLGDDDTVLDSAEENVDVCVGLDLDVTKNAVHGYDRTYGYDIDKSVDDTRKRVDPETGEATFTYTVTVTDGPSADSNWVMSGSITVTNPNDWLPVTAHVTDSVDVGGGAVCTVEGGATVTVPAGRSVALDYSCTFTSRPDYDGTNTATVTWGENVPTPGSSATGTAAVEAGRWSQTLVDKVVDVVDDKTDPANPVVLGQHTWTGEGNSQDYDYALTLQGTEGACVDFTNTAWVDVTGVDPTARESATVCWPLDLTVSKTATAHYDRLYAWDIDKSVDRTSVTVDADGEATFNYVVKAVPAGYTDSGWTMTGAITVTNPNGSAVTVSVADVTDVGGGADCVVAQPSLTVPAKDTMTTSYACSFTGEPDYTGENAATVTWTDAAGDTQQARGAVPVTFTVDTVTDLDVDVRDDKITGAAPGELLGTATWTDPSTTEFAYAMTLQGQPGTCVDHTNTALLQLAAGPGPQDQQTVTVCTEMGPEVSKTVTAHFDREYLWDVEKDVDRTSATISGGTAQFDYVVSAVPSGFADSGWAMSGQVTVANPNAFADMTVTVSDLADVGGTCAVDDGADVVVPAGESVVLDYSCSFVDEPDYAGVNTATVEWSSDAGSGTVTADADVTFEVDGETHRTVEVYDDKVTEDAPGTLLGSATWNAEGTPVTFPYSLDLGGVDGQCADHTNTAVIPATGAQDEQTVTVCTELGPEVAKTAEADFDREYFWNLEKAADADQVTVVDGQSAVVDYTVTATPDGFQDSGWSMAGQITVTNPNAFADGSMTVTVTDVADVGGSCAVTDGLEVVLEPGETRVLDYACSFTEQPEYGGVNTATVDWATGSGVSEGSTTAYADVTFELDGETNLEVEVRDDKVTGVAPGELLGAASWHDGPTSFGYTLELDGAGGTCVDHTNTAVIPATGDQDEQTVTVCTELAPEVSKTVDASFDREYLWNLVKEVDSTDVEISGTDATFGYTVTASEDGFVDSGWAMTGQVSVTNPNTFEGGSLTVSVRDLTDVGAECTLPDGAEVDLEPGQTRVLDYTCAFDEQPDYAGTNTAHVDWTDAAGQDRTTTSDPVDVTFELDGETNSTVEVYDDKVTGDAPGELLGTADWHEGTTVFTYDLTLPGAAGECTTHTNTAVVPATGDTDSAQVTLCVENELVITKTAEADFDREYLWSITKEVDRSEATVEEGEQASFGYVVSATPGGSVDSGWAMSGQITVTNPNAYAEGVVTVDVSDTTDVGGTCAVTDGQDVVLEPGETRVLDYACSFEEQPDYEGSNTAAVTWSGPDGAARSSTVVIPTTFQLDQEVNREIHVHDDLATGVAPGELLGTAIWNADGTATEFTYTLAFGGTVGETTEYVNTAVITETGETDSATVKVTVPVRPVPPVPTPPTIPTGEPVGGVDGGLLAAGVSAMLLALLGAGVALVRRRDNR